MSRYLGDFIEDDTIYFPITTHNGSGAAVAPSTAFEAADLAIYKDGNATQKATTNGVTMTSPFDSVTGLHMVTLDTSNDTGDAGFWVAGADYLVVLNPDETVDSQTVVGAVATFSIENRSALRPTTAGRTLDVTAGGTAGVDWGNVENATTAVDLSGTDIQLCDTVTTNTDLVTAASIADAVWDEPKAGHTTATTFGDLATDLDAVLADTGTDGVVVAAGSKTGYSIGTGGITAASFAAGAVDAAALAADAVDEILDEQIGDSTVTFRQALKLMVSTLGGKLSGAATTTVAIRNVADDTDVVTATVDADGNRSAVTLSL